MVSVKKAAFHADNQELLEKVECILQRGRIDMARGVDLQSIAVLNKALKGIVLWWI